MTTHFPPGVVARVAELAAAKWGDREIGAEVGLTKAQVAGLRARHLISAGRPRGAQPSHRRRDPAPMVDGTPYERWCALLAGADEPTWRAMRRTVCRVLRLSPDVGDEALIVAAQRDPRTAEELANAFMLAWGGGSCG